MSPRASQFGAAIAALVVMAGPAAWATPETQVRLSPADISALAKGGAGPGSSGVADIQTTVLSGDPTTAGLYTIALRVPPHTVIAAHTHRDDRSVVVVSGTWGFGYGPVNTPGQLKLLEPGGFYTEPGGDAHFARTGDEPALVYITGVGPTDTRYVNAAADPR